MNALSSGCRESRKKSERIQGEGFSGSADSLETFLERLRDRCQDNGGCHGPDRAGRIQEQARCARALAVEFGILKQSPYRWEEFRDSSTAVWMGSEHLVEFSPQSSRYAKTTIPPAFGLTPAVISLPVANLRADPNRPSLRQAIEFVLAAPLEYLERWQSSNDIFGDDVRLASVIEWPDGAVSFGITQPQYHGVPAEPRDIERGFLDAGWTRLKDPSGHVAFFNHAFRVMAIDAERRNCYLTDGQLQPFDVILCTPDEEMKRYLGIYPSE